MTDIRTRKTDHIALSLQPQHQALHGPGLDRLSFEPKPIRDIQLFEKLIKTIQTQLLFCNNCGLLYKKMKIS